MSQKICSKHKCSGILTNPPLEVNFHWVHRYVDMTYKHLLWWQLWVTLLFSIIYAVVVGTNELSFSSRNCDNAPLINWRHFVGVHYLLFKSTLFSAGKVSRCYQSHWRVWDKACVDRYVFWKLKLWIYLAGRNLNKIVKWFQPGCYWKKWFLCNLHLSN